MFLFNEDRALHAKLQSLVVDDVNAPDSGRPVGVIWMDGDFEMQNLTYPSVIITQSGISRAQERESRGWMQYPYAPEGFAPWDDILDVTQSPYWSQTPIPYNVDYQIEVLSRTNKHATFLRAVLAGPDYLPTRFGYLEVPEDGTVRRLDLEGGPETVPTQDSDGKRLFHDVYSIRVSTELLPRQIEAYNKVQTVDIDYTGLPQNPDS